MGLAVDSRIKPPDAIITVLQIELEVRATKHNSLVE